MGAGCVLSQVVHCTGSGKTLTMIRALDNFFLDPRPKVRLVGGTTSLPDQPRVVFLRVVFYLTTRVSPAPTPATSSLRGLVSKLTRVACAGGCVPHGRRV
jgi:hypothetical protein